METIKELNIKELEQVNGAGSFCYVIGFSTQPEARACLKEGTGTEDENSGVGAVACSYIGIGAGLLGD